MLAAVEFDENVMFLEKCEQQLAGMRAENSTLVQNASATVFHLTERLRVTEEELEITELEAEQVEFRAAVPFSLSEAGRTLHRHELRLDSRASNTCDIDGTGCRRRGTAYRCTLGCDFDVCLVCHATAHANATRAIAAQEGAGWRLASQEDVETHGAALAQLDPAAAVSGSAEAFFANDTAYSFDDRSTSVQHFELKKIWLALLSTNGSPTPFWVLPQVQLQTQVLWAV